MPKPSEILKKTRIARADALEEQEEGESSRELAVAITKLDEAVMWLQRDKGRKQPTDDTYEVES